jgi:hypothetical protein
VRTADGRSHGIQGSGSAIVKTSLGKIKLTDVKYVLGLRKNLISVGSIIDTGNLVVFSKTHCWILDNFDQKYIIATGFRNLQNRLYSFGSLFEANTVVLEDKATLWHRRFGHLSYKGLNHLHTDHRVEGLPIINPSNRVCKGCLVGR